MKELYFTPYEHQQGRILLAHYGDYHDIPARDSLLHEVKSRRGLEFLYDNGISILKLLGGRRVNMLRDDFRRFKAYLKLGEINSLRMSAVVEHTAAVIGWQQRISEVDELESPSQHLYMKTLPTTEDSWLQQTIADAPEVIGEVEEVVYPTSVIYPRRPFLLEGTLAALLITSYYSREDTVREFTWNSRPIGYDKQYQQLDEWIAKELGTRWVPNEVRVYMPKAKESEVQMKGIEYPHNNRPFAMPKRKKVQRMMRGYSDPVDNILLAYQDGKSTLVHPRLTVPIITHLPTSVWNDTPFSEFVPNRRERFVRRYSNMYGMVPQYQALRDEAWINGSSATGTLGNGTFTPGPKDEKPRLYCRPREAGDAIYVSLEGQPKPPGNEVVIGRLGTAYEDPSFTEKGELPFVIYLNADNLWCLNMPSVTPDRCNHDTLPEPIRTRPTYDKKDVSWIFGLLIIAGALTRLGITSFILKQFEFIATPILPGDD